MYPDMVKSLEILFCICVNGWKLYNYAFSFTDHFNGAFWEHCPQKSYLGSSNCTEPFHDIL